MIYSGVGKAVGVNKALNKWRQSKAGGVSEEDQEDAFRKDTRNKMVKVSRTGLLLKQKKRMLVRLQLLLRSTSLTDQNRVDVDAKIAVLQHELEGDPAFIEGDEIFRRRQILSENEGLMDVFMIFWYLLQPFVENGVLTKQGYIEFYQYVQRSLLEVGHTEPDEEDLIRQAKTMYNADTVTFGRLDQLAFFDLLYDLIDTWTEIVSAEYYATFAWSLLDSLADITANPPVFRKKHLVQCCTSITNEGKMIKQFHENKTLWAKVALNAESMRRVPGAVKRLLARKKAALISEEELDQIQIMYTRMLKEGKVFGTGGEGGIDDGSSVSGSVGGGSSIGDASIGQEGGEEDGVYEWYDDDGQQGEGEDEGEGEPGTKRGRKKKKKAGTEFSAFNAAGRTTMLQLLRQREKVPVISRGPAVDPRKTILQKEKAREDEERFAYKGDVYVASKWNLALPQHLREKWIEGRYVTGAEK